MVLWCYLLWYCVTAFNHFDANPSIWINSVGISVVIGIALVLSVSGTGHQNRDGWQTFRLFLMPFCVSSFSSLIKGKGFFLILPPTMLEIVTSIGVCLGFCTIVMVIKRTGCFSKRCSSSVT